MTDPAAAEAVRVFPSAAQPSIIRAHEKDEVYLQYLTDLCHDAVRRLLGPRQALLWARETRLLAELVYLVLTTGSGLQTLGEEYCDVLQVTGAVGVPPGPLQRGMLVLLQTLAPYLAERLSAPQDEGFAAWQASQLQQRRQQQGQAGADEPGAGLFGWRRVPRQLGAWGHRARERLQQALQPGGRLSGWPAASARLLGEHWPTLLRLHLALFYLYGIYFQPSKRVTGARYLFAGRAFEGRPSYRILGVILLAQLGISGALWAARALGPASPLALPWGAGASRQPAKPRHAVLLEADGTEMPEATSHPGAAAGVEGGGCSSSGGGVLDAASRKCPLCLAPRSHPTATPCGHVFCWRCIAEWVSQKPECPMCRSDVTAPSLVCVYHSDF